jgi:hypothetical protein
MSDKRRDRFVRFATVATIFFEDACLAMAQVESGQSDIQEQISIQAVQDFWDLPLISSGATRSVSRKRAPGTGVCPTTIEPNELPVEKYRLKTSYLMSISS